MYFSVNIVIIPWLLTSVDQLPVHLLCVVQCMCLAPTYELALQIGDVTKQMSKFMGDIRVVFAVRGAEGRLSCCNFLQIIFAIYMVLHN